MCREAELMSDDKMRVEFEAWANKSCLSLTRIDWIDGTLSDYAYSATFDAWQTWQVAYAAGQKAEREAIQKEALQQLTDQAQELDMGY